MAFQGVEGVSSAVWKAVVDGFLEVSVKSCASRALVGIWELGAQNKRRVHALESGREGTGEVPYEQETTFYDSSTPRWL